MQIINFCCYARCMAPCSEGLTCIGTGFLEGPVAAGMQFDDLQLLEGHSTCDLSFEVTMARCRVPGLRRAGGIKLHNVGPKQG